MNELNSKSMKLLYEMYNDTTHIKYIDLYEYILSLENKIQDLEDDRTDLAIFLFKAADKLQEVFGNQLTGNKNNYDKIYTSYHSYKDKALKYMNEKAKFTIEHINFGNPLHGIGVPKEMNKEVKYLGDGVYAIADDWGGIWLHTNDHINPTDKVYLEPEVLIALNKFAEDRGLKK